MGATNSTLGSTVGRAAQALSLRIKSVDAPLNFSDHYPFVMKGIPALWIVGDNDGAPQSAAADAAQRSIHKPNDDMNRAFRWDAAVRLAELNYLIALDVANQADRPRWNRGDVLGLKFGREAAR